MANGWYRVYRLAHRAASEYSLKGLGDPTGNIEEVEHLLSLRVDDPKETCIGDISKHGVFVSTVLLAPKYCFICPRSLILIASSSHREHERGRE
jgi:hypothetical protein